MRSTRRILNCGLCLALVAGGVMLTGCQQANPAVKRSEQAADLLVTNRQSLTITEKMVAESQASLKTLSESNGDLRPTFELFSAELIAVRKQADRVAKEANAVKSQAAVYCSARRTDIATISNVEMRRVAEQRTADMKDRCETVNGLYNKVNNGFAAYLTHLNDLQTYMASELNSGTMRSGKKWIDEALDAGERLRGNIRDLALQVDLTSNVLSPVPIATAQWQTPLTHPDAMADGK